MSPEPKTSQSFQPSCLAISKTMSSSLLTLKSCHRTCSPTFISDILTSFHQSQYRYRRTSFPYSPSTVFLLIHPVVQEIPFPSFHPIKVEGRFPYRISVVFLPKPPNF